MDRGSLVLLVLLATALALPAIAATASAQPVFGTIDGPTAVAPDQPARYNVTVLGVPSGTQANYTLTYYILGPDTTGGSPLQSAPGRKSGNGTRLEINITAPQKDQTITLYVAVSARIGTTTENGSAQLQITVVTPIALSATFRNDAPTAAINVTVRFYVDDRLVATKTIARIDGNGQTTVSESWLPVNLAPGGHSVRIEADLDKNGVIDPSRGELVLSDLFIRETPQLSTGWVLVIVGAVFALAFLGTAALRRRS